MAKKMILLCKTVIGVFCLTLMSCNDVDLLNVSKDVQIDESLVIPIAEGRISIEEVLQKLDFKESIEYDVDTINYVVELDEEYLFDDINMLKNAKDQFMSIAVSPIIVQANSGITISGVSDFQLDLGLEPNSVTNRFDSVVVSSATFQYSLSVTDINLVSTGLGISPSDVKIIVKFPDTRFLNTNVPVSKEIVINQFGQSESFDLTNFVVKTVGMVGIPYEITLKSGNNMIRVGANGKLDVDFKISKLNYKVAYGLFRLEAAESTTVKVPLDALSVLPEGLLFANPRVELNLKSNAGVIYKFNIESLKAFSNDPSVAPVQALFDGNVHSTPEIIMKPESPGSYISKKLRTIDRDYGSLDKLMDRRLDTMECVFSALTDDALNTASLTPGYIIPGMKIQGNIKLLVPLYFKSGSNYILSDTLPDINLPFENINKANLVLKITNAIPATAKFTLRFLDKDKNAISTSIDSREYIIESGKVNNYGVVQEGTVSVLNIELTQAQANELKDAKSMIYTVALEGFSKTENGTLRKYPIQITKNNYIKVKLGAFVNGVFNANLGSNNQ